MSEELIKRICERLEIDVFRARGGKATIQWRDVPPAVRLAVEEHYATPPASHDAGEAVVLDTGNLADDPLYRALDRLYERGWLDKHNEDNYDPRGTQEWQDVLDLFRLSRATPPAATGWVPEYWLVTRDDGAEWKEHNVTQVLNLHRAPHVFTIKPVGCVELPLELRALPPAPSAPAGVQPFQARVAGWMQACFGPAISADRQERNHRFLEEALELVQACGATDGEAHQLVDYVFGRPAGERQQEVGGVMVTLAALCLAHGLDMHQAAETELARILSPDVLERIREKQKRKPAIGPLPGVYPEREPLAAGQEGA